MFFAYHSLYIVRSHRSMNDLVKGVQHESVNSVRKKCSNAREIEERKTTTDGWTDGLDRTKISGLARTPDIGEFVSQMLPISFS